MLSSTKGLEQGYYLPTLFVEKLNLNYVFAGTSRTSVTGSDQDASTLRLRSGQAQLSMTPVIFVSE